VEWLEEDLVELERCVLEFVACEVEWERGEVEMDTDMSEDEGEVEVRSILHIILTFPRIQQRQQQHTEQLGKFHRILPPLQGRAEYRFSDPITFLGVSAIVKDHIICFGSTQLTLLKISSWRPDT
jgi:hypothetical protein